MNTAQGFVQQHAAWAASVYADDARAYETLPFGHEAFKQSLGEYIKRVAHTDSIESLRPILKRAHRGAYHRMRPKTQTSALRWSDVLVQPVGEFKVDSAAPLYRPL